MPTLLCRTEEHGRLTVMRLTPALRGAAMKTRRSKPKLNPRTLERRVRLVGRETMPGFLGFGSLPFLYIRRNARQAAYCSIRCYILEKNEILSRSNHRFSFSQIRISKNQISSCVKPIGKRASIGNVQSVIS